MLQFSVNYEIYKKIFLKKIKFNIIATISKSMKINGTQ